MDQAQPHDKRNYLRVRGEYSCVARRIIKSGELPPRTRRIPYAQWVTTKTGGTTSAYAENTDPCYITIVNNTELPPRARRIHPPGPPRISAHGTTSACAENTLCRLWFSPSRWNYLRVRGEYAISRHSRSHPEELPPRARRILLMDA